MVSTHLKNQLAESASWLERLPPEQWSVYKTVMARARSRGLQFAVGGGFATMTYTGQWRDTKDIDFFILERDKDEMIRILADSGLGDYYDQQAYERHWIYRSYKDEVIVDVIWAMANRRAVVDEAWLRGPEVEIGGERFQLVPAEETLWSKLYVLQRDRCDWPDGLSLIYSMGTDLNWCRLLERVDRDAPLLSGLLSVFGWLCPDRARELPSWLWNELGAKDAQKRRPCGRREQPRPTARFAAVVYSCRRRTTDWAESQALLRSCTMLIGTMNHPEHVVLDEIRRMADVGMEFVDLTLEPPGAASWNVDTKAIRAALQRQRMEVVGHTAWYLPMASAIPEIRKAAVAELRRCLEKFGDVGAKWMNIHPDRHTPWHSRRFYIERNLDSLRELLPNANRCGVGLMIENLPGEYNSAPQLGELLDAIPELGLHLDIGHANLQVPHNTTEEILAAYGNRLRHVHLHDNKGGHADLHLPLGTGTVDVRRSIEALQACGYDGTITLEVFTPDARHLTYSRDLLRTTWNECREAVAADRHVLQV